MNKDELILVKELIKEAVRAVIKEELAALTVKKDLKEVKQLLALSIKEARENKGNFVDYQSNISEVPISNKEQLKKSLREAIGSDFNLPERKAPVMPKISAEQGLQISATGTLPDIDAPIPVINKKSVAWKEFKERVAS
jgi:hypothetical protein